jgi:hypothetical protein
MKIVRITACALLSFVAMAQPPQRWTEAAANDWYAKQQWLVGANYVTSTAVNQLEMWQSDTFDPVTIDRELGWAQSLGMNTMRVFLHDILWQRDSAGFERRLNVFLKLADQHNIRPIFVLFDSVWDPFPGAGQQSAPRPGVHNSRWVQSPGATKLLDAVHYNRLFAYIQGLLTDYAKDKRILAWDLWNEPDNRNSGEYGKGDPANKDELVQNLLPKVFAYARAALPSQPLTTGVWGGDWSDPQKLTPVQKIQLENSDIISFHSYGKPEEFEKRVQWLQAYHRPIFCTEYMARSNGSTFQGILPIAKKYNVAAFNWGLVQGKTQTYLPWDSWQHPYTDREPAMWFHDIFRPNGAPYSQEEADFIRTITGRPAAGKARPKKAA